MQTTDLTTGAPLRKILLFALPLVGGALFQQLYNFTDTVIVGHLIGIDGVAAVGTFYPLNFLILGFIQGACIGFSIPLSQQVGAKNKAAVNRFFTNAWWLCLGLTLLLTPLMILLTPSLLTHLHTPANILEMAIKFTTISFIGIPANILYNYAAAALRAFGDSVHPLYFLIISLIINVGLDLFFIAKLHMGIAGAAWATVISEFIGGLLNLSLFLIGPQRLKLIKSDWQIKAQSIKELCRIGLPMGFEYAVSAIGALIMQTGINRLGSNIVAAQSAAEKIRQLFTLPMESVGAAMATYQAQNYGAHNRQRLKQGVLSGVLIQIIYACSAFLILMLSKQYLLTLVLGTNVTPILNNANRYILIISLFFPIHGFLMIFRNTLQGWGYSLPAIFSGFGELIGRAAGGFLAMGALGFTAICFANPLAWGLALIYCLIMTRIIYKNKLQQMLLS
ncbi:MATE family efflux transporter [Agrilactobacillus yilanensis]|uniref:MATE family efflux transporter n=1 Tax=Agrilactobacillus yilanensis TaxID=2485997 RepID=A0ABW4JAY7_9LACO|nr:MATE family efflux transporter [Agrilactobacillus yilanensis]